MNSRETAVAEVREKRSLRDIVDLLSNTPRSKLFRNLYELSGRVERDYFIQ